MSAVEKVEDGELGTIEQHISHVSNVVDDPNIQWTDIEEAIVRRKLDLHIVPLVTLLYLLCFLDRANIGNARIEGLAKDLDLGGVRFNWALSVFYITYLLFEIPSNIMLRLFGGRYYLPCLVVGFGLISLCTAFVNSFSGLLIVRSFLGVFEGGAMPGFAFFLSCFYQRHELMLRISFFVSAAGLAGAFGGLLATVLSRIPEWGVASLRIHTWRNIFFFEGLVTIFLGLLAPLWMPNSAAEASFLTRREQQIAYQRLIQEQQENPKEQITLKDVKRAFMSIHNYTCGFGFFFANITVQGLAVFMPTILADLGWTATKAQLMTVPPNCAATACAICVGYFSDRVQKRGPFIFLMSGLAVAGLAILRWNSSANIRYMGIFLAISGAGSCGPAFLSWAMNNSGGLSVRAVTSAYVVTLGTLGGLVATWTYLARDSPEYYIGHMVNFVGQIIGLWLSVFGTAYCIMENRARIAGRRDGRLEGLTEEEKVKLGHDHPSFRFML